MSTRKPQNVGHDYAFKNFFATTASWENGSRMCSMECLIPVNTSLGQTSSTVTSFMTPREYSSYIRPTSDHIYTGTVKCVPYQTVISSRF